VEVIVQLLPVRDERARKPGVEEKESPTKKPGRIILSYSDYYKRCRGCEATNMLKKWDNFPARNIIVTLLADLDAMLLMHVVVWLRG